MSVGIETVQPTHTVTLKRDLADGCFDGFSSWTEKPVNHRFFSRVVRSRLNAQRARALVDPPTAAMDQALADALTARLTSLSTTHFGLANPALHPDREAAGEAVTMAAETHAATALELALAERGVPPMTVANPTGHDVTFLMPVAASRG